MDVPMMPAPMMTVLFDAILSCCPLRSSGKHWPPSQEGFAAISPVLSPVTFMIRWLARHFSRKVNSKAGSPYPHHTSILDRRMSGYIRICVDVRTVLGIFTKI